MLFGREFGSQSNFQFKSRDKTALKLKFEIDFNNIQNLEQLFQLFCEITHNVTTDGDFRNHPEEYVSKLSGGEYFLFSGDGYCTSLAFQFQELAKKILGIEIKSRYCRSDDGEYTHAYNQLESRVYDTALKHTSSFEELMRDPPAGWIYTLIKRAGMLIYDGLSEKEKNFLFDDVSIKSFEFMNEGNFQLVYKKGASLGEVYEKFKKIISERSIDIDLRKNDFEWKTKYPSLS